MAARRLIVVLLVLLAISIVAAAIAPDRRAGFLREGDQQEEPTVQETTTAPSGGALTRTVTASAERPETIRAEVGDQLGLTVEVDGFAEVRIEPLGLIESASPDDPAIFDLLLREPGELTIRSGEGGEVAGRIVVGDAPRPGSGDSVVP